MPHNPLLANLIVALENNDELNAQKLLQQLEKETTLNNNTVSVVMFTACCWGTMGDPSAAAKLMQKLSQQHPKIKFSWIVKIDRYGKQKNINIDTMQNLIADNPEINLTVLYEDDESLSTRAWQSGWPELWKDAKIIDQI